MTVPAADTTPMVRCPNGQIMHAVTHAELVARLRDAGVGVAHLVPAVELTRAELREAVGLKPLEGK